MKTLYEDADKWHNQYRKKSGNERYHTKSGLLCFYFTEPLSLLVVVTIQ